MVLASLRKCTRNSLLFCRIYEEMLQGGMNRFDSWATETGRRQYCNGALRCRGKRALVLSAGGMKAAKQWLDCVSQLWGLALIGNH